MEFTNKENKLFFEFIAYNNKDSFQELYQLVTPWLYKVIYKIVQKREVARDIFQESWYIAIKEKNKFNPERGSINNLLYTIAKNLALQHINKTNLIQRELKDDYLSGSQSFSSQTPEQEKIKSDDLEILRKAVLKLPDKYQHVIVLFYYGELSINEIAVKLKINENTIKTLLTRGRKKIEAEILKYG